MVDFPKDHQVHHHHGATHTGQKTVAYQSPTVTAPAIAAHHEERADGPAEGTPLPKVLAASTMDASVVSFNTPKQVLTVISAIKAGSPVSMSAKVDAINAMNMPQAQKYLDELLAMHKQNDNPGFMAMLAVRAAGNTIATHPLPQLKENGEARNISFSTTEGTRFSIDVGQVVKNQVYYSVTVTDKDDWSHSRATTTAGGMFSQTAEQGNANGSMGEALHQVKEHRIKSSEDTASEPCEMQGLIQSNTDFAKDMARSNPFGRVPELPRVQPPDIDPIAIDLPHLAPLDTNAHIHVDSIGEPPPPPKVGKDGPTAAQANHVVQQQVAINNDILKDMQLVSKASTCKDLEPELKKYHIRSTGDVNKDKALLGNALIKREDANAANGFAFARNVRKSDWYKALSPEDRAGVDAYLNKLTGNAHRNHIQVYLHQGRSLAAANSAFDNLLNKLGLTGSETAEPDQGADEHERDLPNLEPNGGFNGLNGTHTEELLIDRLPLPDDNDHVEPRLVNSIIIDNAPRQDGGQGADPAQAEVDQQAVSQEHAQLQQAVSQRAVIHDEEQRAHQEKVEERDDQRLTGAGVRQKRLADQAHELATGSHQALQDEARRDQVRGK